MLVIGAASIFFQILPPKSAADQAKSLILFGIIIGYVLLVFSVIWIIDLFKGYSDKANHYIQKIQENTEQIAKIKENMNTENRFFQLEKRLSIIESFMSGLENMRKKGNLRIEPAIIFIIILLVLFYLYLRSLGLVK